MNAAAQHLGVGSYKTDGVTQVPTRGVSMIMSAGDTGGVPYGAIMPQLTTLQITPQSVSV